MMNLKNENPLIHRFMNRLKRSVAPARSQSDCIKISSKPGRRAAWTTEPLEERLMLAGDLPCTVSPTSLGHPANTSLESLIHQDCGVNNAAELVFIDMDVQRSSNLGSIVDQNAEVILIEADSDPIDQISRAIGKHPSVKSIHLISHGQSGELQLAGQKIDVDYLASRGQELNGWRSSLTPDADILIYGCDVAAGKEGQQLLRSLALLTGADVAGSIDRTGSFDQGGNWILESSTGLIESDLIASAASLASVSVALPITVRAAGSEGDEQMQLQIDGTTVQTWNNVGGDVGDRQFQTFTYDGGEGVTADRVRIVFSNDRYQPAQGIDRNLHVDSITVNGDVFQTEDISVFSTGTWQDGAITPGFKESETLHANGYFQFAESSQNNGSEISIFAAGNENSETMELWIDGNQITTWTNIGGDADDRQFVRYDFTAESTVDINDVQIHFTNDLFTNEGEVDRNLHVDRIVLDGVTYQTEAPIVFSTGTWRDGDVNPGFEQSEVLHVNGYFQYGDTTTSQPGTIALETSNITIDEDAGNAEVRVLRSGGSDGTVTVDYATVASSAIAGEDYTFQNGTLTFADGVTEQSIVIPILNDSDVESTEVFNVTINNVGGGGTLLVPRTATVTIIDDEIALPQYNDFSSVAGLEFNGSAQQLGSLLELTPDSDNQAGSVFFDSTLTLEEDASFQAAFSFEFAGGTDGADGLTFTVQADPAGASAIGSSGGSLGYDGIANSIAIEFDTYQNGTYDPNENHVSILQGNTSNAIETTSPSIDLNSGVRLYAWVDYNGVSDSLSVYLSESATKPELALAKTTIDLESFVGQNAYFGFTGGTGGLEILSIVVF
jgi:hypothetical protein